MDFVQLEKLLRITSASHYITLHHITSHYITLHHITSHYITLHHITSHYITLHHITSQYIPLHHITSHYITLHHITSHYITSHYITIHHITSHCISLNYNHIIYSGVFENECDWKTLQKYFLVTFFSKILINNYYFCVKNINSLLIFLRETNSALKRAKC